MSNCPLIDLIAVPHLLLNPHYSALLEIELGRVGVGRFSFPESDSPDETAEVTGTGVSS